jgi:hypothetical protein
VKGQKQTGATDPVTPVLFLSRLGKILLLSVLSHDVFQLWRLDGFLDFKAELLIKFFCRLIAIKNGQGDAFDRVLFKNEIHKAFQRRCPQAPACFSGIQYKAPDVDGVAVDPHLLYHPDERLFQEDRNR